jgi:peptidoglycan/xylan/chitin deacetylase (PgdA/CDA1 family)
MYHGVAEAPAFNCVTAGALREQLEQARTGHLVVRPSELIRAVREGETADAPLLALTFDDAYESFFTHAYPLLRELKLPAGLAVPAGHVGGVNQWDVDHGYPAMKIMGWEEIRALDPFLVEFGSHGVSHRSFAALSESEARHEARASKVTIEENVGAPVTWFAYPYGKLEHLHPGGPTILAEAGYEAACSTRWGRFNALRDLYALRRIDVWPDDSLDDFKAKLGGAYDWLVPKERLAFAMKRVVGGRRP